LPTVLFDLYQRWRGSALGTRITRYTIGSAVAFATSAIVFPVLYVLGASTTACSIGAFVAGAIPNWVLNRRWAWKLRGRIAVGREVVAYVTISALQLVLTSLTTAWTQRHVQGIPAHHGFRAALVTAAYLAVFVVMFAGKFAIYEFWIFSGRSRIRAALRSRRAVWSAQRASRATETERAT
jgi:putative flippase GtrA